MVRNRDAIVGRRRRSGGSARPSPPPSPTRGERVSAKERLWARAGEGGRGAAKWAGLVVGAGWYFALALVAGNLGVVVTTDMHRSEGVVAAGAGSVPVVEARN